VLRIANARSGRLALSEGPLAGYKWAAVLILALVAQIGVATVHLERPRPQILALLIFTASAVLALNLIAAGELPYEGSHQVSPAPLERLASGFPAVPPLRRTRVGG